MYITDHDKPAHVLLTVEAYPRLTGGKKIWPRRWQCLKRQISISHLNGLSSPDEMPASDALSAG
ncbi:hypothetical protein [Pantoea ananatis]|uniref:hypothetical protein n=1 Tax=Pantoea ananas TaxID=553 RepID=UPI001DFA80A5|nr:hypothetical protein [Pantoea ananatis]NQE76435.1 hypothetical protein [Pantoea ananatis]NQE81070.1 hypothetical protein [Pantoea ananatis]